MHSEACYDQGRSWKNQHFSEHDTLQMGFPVFERLTRTVLLIEMLSVHQMLDTTSPFVHQRLR